MLIVVQSIGVGLSSYVSDRSRMTSHVLYRCVGRVGMMMDCESSLSLNGMLDEVWHGGLSGRLGMWICWSVSRNHVCRRGSRTYGMDVRFCLVGDSRSVSGRVGTIPDWIMRHDWFAHSEEGRQEKSNSIKSIESNWFKVKNVPCSRSSFWRVLRQWWMRWKLVRW